MRKRPIAGKLLLFALFYLGCSNLMNARSQSNAWLASYSQASMNVADQAPEIRVQARSISSILAEARKTFDVDFIYESKVLPGARVVMDVDKYKSVEDFLDELLRPYNLKYKKVLNRAYVIYSNSPELKRLISNLIREGVMTADVKATSGVDARSIVITGQILENGGTGAPLEGVSVTVKGTNKGTITDKDGRFKLEVENRECRAGLFAYWFSE